MKLIPDKHANTLPAMVMSHFKTVEPLYFGLISKTSMPSMSAFVIAYRKIAFWQKRKLAGRGLERLFIGNLL